MDEDEARRYRSKHDEYTETPVEEEIDEYIETAHGYPEAEEELGENEENYRESVDEERIEWLELERAKRHLPEESRQNPLFRSEDLNQLRERWNSIQATFVDEPRSSVEQADVLVGEIMERIVSTFSEERSLLDKQWDRDDDVSTEDLRVALQRYRAFFNRLLSL